MPTQGKACWQIKAKEEVLFCDRPYIKDKNHPKAEEKKSHLLKFFLKKRLCTRLCAVCLKVVKGTRRGHWSPGPAVRGGCRELNSNPQQKQCSVLNRWAVSLAPRIISLETGLDKNYFPRCAGAWVLQSSENKILIWLMFYTSTRFKE